jgi:hypothetical protein
MRSAEGAPDHWYAWDIDLCWIAVVAGAGVFASAQDALREWRDAVGPAASGAALSSCPAGRTAQLLGPYLRTGPLADMLQGNEPRDLIREYYRLRRRAAGRHPGRTRPRHGRRPLTSGPERYRSPGARPQRPRCDRAGTGRAWTGPPEPPRRARACACAPAAWPGQGPGSTRSPNGGYRVGPRAEHQPREGQGFGEGADSGLVAAGG